jgi:hypothetical protein
MKLQKDYTRLEILKRALDSYKSSGKAFTNIPIFLHWHNMVYHTNITTEELEKALLLV